MCHFLIFDASQKFHCYCSSRCRIVQVPGHIYCHSTRLGPNKGVLAGRDALATARASCDSQLLLIFSSEPGSVMAKPGQQQQFLVHFSLELLSFIITQLQLVTTTKSWEGLKRHLLSWFLSSFSVHFSR